MNDFSPPIARPFTQESRDRLSLEAFRALLTTYTSPLEQMRESLVEASLPFETQRGIIPFQCRNAIRLLRTLKTEKQRCCKFLRDTQQMPFILVSLRYQLLNHLHYLEERADRLISYLSIMAFPPCSHAQRTEVCELFGEILPLLADIPQQISSLFDEARFQEKRILSHGEGRNDPSRGGGTGYEI